MPTPVARVAAKPGCGGKEAILVVRAPDRRDGVPSNLILVLMMSVTILNVMDRQLLAVLIEPIGLELGASDTAMGLLTGTSFALLHVVASFPVAIWADRGDRRTIIALGSESRSSSSRPPTGRPHSNRAISCSSACSTSR